MAGRKPGTPKTGGRAKGTVNKATASIKDMARQHTADALKALVEVVKGGDGVPAAARVTAAQALLDRGYGKPTQPLSGDDDMDPISMVTTIELVALGEGAD